MISEKFLSILNIMKGRAVNDKLFIFIMSIIVGILAGLVAVALKTSVRVFQDIFHSSFDDQFNTYFYFIYPIAGLLLSTFYIQKFRNGNLSRGIGNVIREISNNKGIIARHKLYSQLISSFFTLIFGGSAGLESPISVTGAAIGSNISLISRTGEKQRKLLLGCGAAGGIAAIFNSPIAGVLFALETLVSELSIPNFIPLLISSASATVVSKLLFTGQPFKLITQSWEISSIPYYILLGVLCSLLSLYNIKIYFYFQKTLGRWKRPYVKAISGGIILGALLFIFPALYGEGYNIVESFLNGKYLVLFNKSLFWQSQQDIRILLIYGFLILMLKVVATSLTVNSGGNGGMFGSSLFAGALLGFVFSKFINVMGFHRLDEVNFIVVAMAGTLGGIIHAPLTAIFLIAEITGGYALFIPLMIVVSISYLITNFFEPYSVYTKRLAEEGKFILYDRDRLILENIQLIKFIDKDYVPLRENDSLENLREIIKNSTRTIFPVINNDEKLLGLVSVDDIRELMFDRSLDKLILVRDTMARPDVVAEMKDSMFDVVRKMDEHNLWDLPVVKDGKYIGFVSKSKILNHYRELLTSS